MQEGKRNPLICLLNDENFPDGVTGLMCWILNCCSLHPGKILKIGVMQDN